MSLDDQDPWAHWALSIVNMYKRRLEEALREAERAIALNPSFAEAHVNLGEVLHYSGRSEEALNIL